MHKFFRGSKKTIAAMMAVLMFTSSTGGYAQAGMIQDAFPETQKIVQDVQENTDTPVTEDAETVVTKPDTEVPTGEPTKEPAEDSAEDSAEGSVDNPTPEVTETPKPTEKLEEKNKDASKETTADSEKKSETSEKKETSEDSNELSNTVTRFIQEKDSYAYMEQITNMDDLLSEMNEEQLYELLYFMRLSFLSEVPEKHSQTLDIYYEILNAYIRAKTGDPKQEWQDLVLPYLPYYQEGMETTEDYLDVVDGKDFDLSYLEEQLSSLEDCQDSDILAGKAEPVTIEAAMESVRQDILDGNPADAIWTMYHYGYMADVLTELDYETLEGFFQGLSEDDRFVFNTLAGYEYFRFVDQGYALDGYKEKAEMLQYFYQEAAESDAADQILLSYLNKQNKKTYSSVEAYVAEMTKDSSENFAEVMEAWNLFLAGRVDTLVKKVNKEEIKDEPSKPEDSHEPLAPDTPDVDVPDTGDSTGDDLGGAGDDLPKKDIGTGDTLSDVEYPSLGKNYNDGIALASAQYNKNVNGGQWVAISNTWYFLQSNGQILYNSWVLDGNDWYFIKPNGWAVVSAYAVIDNVAYHFNAKGADDGKLSQGWVVSDINGGWYYIYNGTAQYGWVWPQEKSVADAAGNTYCYYWCGPSDDRVMRANGYYSIWCAEAGQNLDYYLDNGGHLIQATIGGNSYYSAFNANNGAIDCAWNGSTVVLKGGNHNVSAQHGIYNKNVTITTDGSHRCYIRNSNTATGAGRPTILYISGGTLTINGYISWDGGNRNSEKAASDVLIAENGGTLTFDSANAKVFNCNQGLHGTSDSPNGAKVNFYAGEIYNCYFGIGTYNNVTMTGGTIRNCEQGVHLNACYRDIVCDITGGTIKDNAGHGVVGHAAEWGSPHRVGLTVDNTTITGNGNGVCMTASVTANSSVTLNNDNINNNTTGVMIGAGTLNIGEYNNVNVKNNTSRGVCITNANSVGRINKAQITGNGKSADSGAGIYTLGTIYTTASTNVSNNKGAQGGGICGDGNAVLNINGTPIKDNTAHGCGGGICSHGTLNLSGSTLTGNTATGDGGAIWYNKGNISGCGITGNTANNIGGGVSLSGGTSTLTNNNIDNNKANQGGGMYTDGNLTISSGTFNNNNASGNGGGIISNGTITMNGGSITGNYSGWDGGGVNSRATFNFNGGAIQNNTAYWLGGNIHVQAVDNINNKQSVFTVTSKNPISGGKAEGSGGGGVCVYGTGAKLILNDGTSVKDNTAPTGGGINGNAAVEMKNATISGNKATSNNGGGIELFSDQYGTGSFKMTSGTIENNTATSEGGGFHGPNFTMTGGTIQKNNAGTVAGGVLVNGTGACSMSGGTITNNTSTYGAGGLWVDDNTPFTMGGGTISNNTAGGDGGGIYNDNGNITLSGGSVTGNKANVNAGSGGGIRNSGTLTVNGTASIDNNTAYAGGGVHSTTGNIVVSGNAKVNKNTATECGGGINAEYDGSDDTITIAENAQISNNMTKSDGGGISLFPAKLVVSGGKIQNNTAGVGGGIASYADGDITMTDGEISGNTAISGGGIYLSQPKMTMSGGSIHGNTAKLSENSSGTDGYGGGIMSLSGKNPVTITGGSIYGNTAESGLANAYYQGGKLFVGKDASITGDIYLYKNKIINVISDLTKANLEVSMAENYTYKQRVIAEYSADTTSYKNGTDDTKRYSLETNTAGYAKTKGIRIEDNSTKGSLYQVWLDSSELPIRVNYIGRYADSGSVKTEIVEPGTETYTVQKNSGYTRFSRKDYTFQGWAYRLTDKKPTYSEKSSNVISYDDLRSIWQEQQEAGITGDMFKTQSTESSRSVAGIALAAMQNALSGLIFPAQVQAAENDQVWDVYMLDTWDKVPTITWKENTFWEGTDVYKADLLKNIRISDLEDGTIDVSKLVINSITYSAGKLENGTKAASYTVNYPKGMQDSDKLDTWFMQLDKNDSPVTHVLHCSVTDSAGNVAKADITVKVKYNEFPTITAQDRYFTLEEAQGGQITKDALLKNAITDGKLSANDTEEGNLNNKLDMVDFKASDFTSFTDSGYVTVTFHVQDSMGPGGKGKETYRQIKVYVVKDGVIEEPEKAQNIRFINKKYYDLNKGVNPDTLSEEEKEARNGNGGLNVESKWYHDPEYQAVIEAAFGKTQGTDYEFTKEDIDKIKAYVDANGIGTTRSDAALDNFYSQFVAPAKVN